MHNFNQENTFLDNPNPKDDHFGHFHTSLCRSKAILFVPAPVLCLDSLSGVLVRKACIGLIVTLFNLMLLYADALSAVILISLIFSLFQV